MKWIIVAAIVIVALAAVMAVAALVGSRLPRAHAVSRTAALAAPPDAVWAAITNVDAFPSWRADVKKVDRLPDREGRPVWVEQGPSGRLTLAVERMDPPRVLVVRIADPDLPFGGTWTYVIVSAPGGSRLTISENGEVYNPLFRFMARFIFGYEGTIASYMKALEQRFGRAAGS
jgi:uncharacterized protein YndB with AHSA1/START domain